MLRNRQTDPKCAVGGSAGGTGVVNVVSVTSTTIYGSGTGGGYGGGYGNGGSWR